MQQTELNRRRIMLPKGGIQYPPYLEFLGDESFSMTTYNTSKNWDGTLEFSTDKENWTEWNGASWVSSVISDGKYRLYLRGKNNTKITGDENASRRFRIVGGQVECNGDIRTLLNYESPENTVISNYCFAFLFRDCNKLIKAPALPSTVLSRYCYSQMFLNCSLQTAPELPATILAEYCYDNMFFGNSPLREAPALPATTLAENCYDYMFGDCISLVKTPKLSAKNLQPYCYQRMFKGCSNLSEITMLATEISAYQCLNIWVEGVAATGTFYKDPNMTTLPTGSSGIPSGWTVQDYPN